MAQMKMIQDQIHGFFEHQANFQSRRFRLALVWQAPWPSWPCPFGLEPVVFVQLVGTLTIGEEESSLKLHLIYKPAGTKLYYPFVLCCLGEIVEWMLGRRWGESVC